MKTKGQIAYENDVRLRPRYHDGTKRKTWEQLDNDAKRSWEKESTDIDKTTNHATTNMHSDQPTG